MPGGVSKDVKCPVCGMTVKARGLKSHIKLAHSTAEYNRFAGAPAPAEGRATVEARGARQEPTRAPTGGGQTAHPPSRDATGLPESSGTVVPRPGPEPTQSGNSGGGGRTVTRITVSQFQEMFREELDMALLERGYVTPHLQQRIDDMVDEGLRNRGLK